MKNIILIGMSGVGKSTIGACLSRILNRDFIDMDRYLEEKYSVNIEEVFENEGERYFRNLESKVLKEVLTMNNKVVATGGGIILRKDNRDMLEKEEVIYLKGSIDTIYKNIVNDTVNVRPLLKEDNILSVIKNMYGERKLYYIESSKYIVDTDNKSVNDISNEISNTIENHSCS